MLDVAYDHCDAVALKKAERFRLNREWQLQSKYGIGIEDFDAMLEAQGGACAICRTTEPGGRHDVFNVDHDHTTKKIRGLLCWDCNSGVGKLGDGALLRAALTYVESKG